MLHRQHSRAGAVLQGDRVHDCWSEVSASGERPVVSDGDRSDPSRRTAEPCGRAARLSAFDGEGAGLQARRGLAPSGGRRRFAGRGRIMISVSEIVILVVIAALGHVMALFWYVAGRNKWRICEATIYDLPIGNEQIRRELRNSLHAPIHAVLLAAFLYLGFFRNTSATSFAGSVLATAIWAETWHYASHRAFHLKAL